MKKHIREIIRTARPAVVEFSQNPGGNFKMHLCNGHVVTVSATPRHAHQCIENALADIRRALRCEV